MKNKQVLIWLRAHHALGEVKFSPGMDIKDLFDASGKLVDRICDDSLVFETLERNLSSAESWPSVLRAARENKLRACLYFSNAVLNEAGAPQTKNRTMYLALETILHFNPENDVMALMCLIEDAFADLEKTGNVSYIEIRQD